MSASLTALVDLRSRLAEDLLAYLDALVEELAALPAYFPAHLRTQAGTASGFDSIRQVVQVIEDREAFEQWLRSEARAAEQERAAGRELSPRAYAPRRARPERAEEEDKREDERREPERPPPPPPVPWDDAASARFRHAVILADPGFGKTWLLKHEAIHLARQAAGQLRARRHGVEAIVLPIFVRLSELARSDDELDQALTRHVLGRVSTAWKRRAKYQAAAGNPAALPLRLPPTHAPGLAAYLKSQLARGHCAVHIDAWDEVPPETVDEGGFIRSLPGYRQRQGERLKAFAEGFSGPLRLTSRLVGYGGKLIPGAQELELIAFEPPQIEAFLGVWFPDGERRQVLLTLLQEQHTLRGLSRIPLMLTLLCRAFQQEGALPERRVDLYEKCLRGLLRDWLTLDKQADRGDQTLSESYLEALLELLAGTAHALHCQEREQFTEKELTDAIRAALRSLASGDELHGRTPSSLIQELKRDGVLIALGDDAPAYLFLHRTLQEYLAARELARQAKEPARYAEIIQDIVERLWWLPEWWEVIVLLAGLVDDPVPLLNALAQERGDDIARRRLGLAGLALGEIDRGRFGKSAALRMWRDQIATKAVNWWLGQRGNQWSALTLYVARSFSTLVHCRGRYHNKKQLPIWIAPNLREWIGDRFPRYQGLTLLDWIATCLSGQTTYEKTALELLSRVRIATPPFLSTLAQLLRDPDEDVRASAADAVGRLGAAAATPPILATLAELLRDPVRLVRQSAAEAVGEMGAIAATPKILEALAGMLHEPGVDVPYALAADYLDNNLRPTSTSSPISRPLLVRALAALFSAPEVGSPGSATRAIRGLGEAAATPAFLATLARLLRDPDKVVRRFAAKAVGELGAAAATPLILESLWDLLRDPEEDVRLSATQAVGTLGAAAATPTFFAILARLLRDTDKVVRRSATQAVGALGAAAATPLILEALWNLLRDPEEDVRRSATEAVGALGAAAATPPILETLAEQLRDPEANMRCSAVKAVGELGAVAATSPILETLAERLRDPESTVCKAALAAVPKLGATVATPLFFLALAELMKHAPTVGVRELAAARITMLVEYGLRIPIP